MANQRERSRVKTVKESLENLRAILPSAAKRKKMSQLETLKHAVDYIQDLASKLIEDSEQDVILNFDLTKLEEYSVVETTTSGSAQSISGSGNQVQVAVTADTPQVAPQPGKHTACTYLVLNAQETSFFY